MRAALRLGVLVLELVGGFYLVGRVATTAFAMGGGSVQVSEDTYPPPPPW
jgi:hypothetical protein